MLLTKARIFGCYQLVANGPDGDLLLMLGHSQVIAHNIFYRFAIFRAEVAFIHYLIQLSSGDDTSVSHG